MAEGAAVVLAARSEAKLKTLASELGELAHAVVGDVASCKAIVPAAIATIGGLDIVVYTAGIAEPCAIGEMSVECFRTHLDINLTVNFIVAQAAPST